MTNPLTIIADAIASSTADDVPWGAVAFEIPAQRVLDALTAGGYAIVPAGIARLPKFVADLKPGMLLRMRDGSIRRIVGPAAVLGYVVQQIIRDGAPGPRNYMMAAKILRDAVEVVEAP